MYKVDKDAEKKKNKIMQRNKRNDVVIEIILAIITVISVPSTIVSLREDVGKYGLKTMCGVLIITIVVAVFLFVFFKRKIAIIKKSYISEAEYIREQKINQINKGVFESLNKSSSSKVREIFRYTYGKVPEWNPINYRDNVLVYDVHEQIRSILISIEQVVISIDPERFNENNVSVELVYCYPENNKEGQLPISKRLEDKENYPWKLISSGDTSGNQQFVLDHLSNKESFFTLVDCCGTVYKNNKYSNIERYQADTVEKRLGKVDNNIFFVKDVRDLERSKLGECKGTAIGTVINIRNDNPENIFVKAILTINTYGESIFSSSSGNEYGKPERDKFYLTEDDYHDIFCDTILSTYTKLLETELAQMYIRHSIRNGFICPYSGRKIPKLTTLVPDSNVVQE